jgi:hypothetical protein
MSEKLNKFCFKGLYFINTLSQNRKKAKKTVDSSGGGTLTVYVVSTKNGSNLNVTPTDV